MPRGQWEAIRSHTQTGLGSAGEPPGGIMIFLATVVFLWGQTVA